MYSYVKSYIDTIIDKKQDLKDVIEWLIPALFQAHSHNRKLNIEMIKFAIMDEKAGEIESFWRNKENEELQRLMVHYGEEIKIKNKKTAAIIIHIAALEIFHYIYDNSDDVDVEGILEEIMEMIKNSLIR